MEKKDLFSKSLLGLSVVGIIAASCSSDGLWTESDENSEYLNSLSDEGKAALSINLTQDEIEYLNFLNKLAQDVIKEPAVARQFACDPNAFIQQYGYKGEVNLDEGMLKLILTLGDDDINTAINQNDITTALALMQSKGLLDDISKSDTQIKFSDEEVKKIYAEMGINVDDDFISQKKYGFAAVWPVYVIAAVVSQLGVGYNVVAGINAAIAVTVYLVVEAWGQSKNVNNVTNANLPLKIWSLKGQDANSFVAADQYISDQSKKIVNIGKENNPELLNYVSEAELEQVVKLNILSTNKKK